MNAEAGLTTFIVVCVSLVIYLFPATVASGRKHNNSVAIFAFNLLLGWSVLGWIAALIWALTDNVKRRR